MQVEYLEEELTTKDENLKHRIKMLETENKRVTNELDCCRTFEEENKTLKQTLRELREEIDSKEVPRRPDPSHANTPTPTRDNSQQNPRISPLISTCFSSMPRFKTRMSSSNKRKRHTGSRR